MQELREKLKQKKELIKKARGEDEPDDEVKEEEEEVVVRHDFVASSARDNQIIVWNATRGESVMFLSGHDGWVNSISFHHNGKYLLSASDDKSI